MITLFNKHRHFWEDVERELKKIEKLKKEALLKPRNRAWHYKRVKQMERALQLASKHLKRYRRISDFLH